MVGAVYCTKEHNPDRRAWHEWSADAAVEVRGGLAPIDTLAFGVILVRRDVFTTMVDKGAAPLHSHRNGTFNNFFAPRRDDLDAGKFLSEDLAFCRRWRIDCGGEIWAYLDAKIGHIGDYAYGADQSYLDWLKEKGAFTPQGA